MSNKIDKIEMELPIFLDWEGITFKNEVFKQYSETEELNFKYIIDLNKAGNLKYFSLIPRDKEYRNFANFCIDLETGIFSLNGIKLDVRPEIFKPKDDGIQIKTIIPVYRVIYFRRMRVEMRDDEKPLLYLHRYILGWQTTFEGKNYQRMMFINPRTLTIQIKEKR